MAKQKASYVTIQVLTPYYDNHGHVVFRRDKDEPELHTHLGDGPAVVSQGYGGWTQVTRPRRKPLTNWEGGVLWQLSVPLLLSGWFNDSSVESRIRRLEQMARDQGGNDEPPVVNCLLPGESPRNDSYLWVIDNIEWGATRIRKDGHRIYQEATLTLTEYVRPDIIKLSPAKAHKKAAPKRKTVKNPPKARKYAPKKKFVG